MLLDIQLQHLHCIAVKFGVGPARDKALSDGHSARIQTGGLQQVVNKCTANRFHFTIQEDNNYSKENPKIISNC